MTPEDQLCLLLARGHLTPDLRPRILEFLASALQWPLVLERAYTHQVYPLVYRNLRELGFPSVPDAVQAELKGAFVANAFRNQLLAEELARLLGLLGKAGIPVIPLKGVTLAQSLYGDAALRICFDIDILVPPNTVPEALDLIRASGYRDDFREPFFRDLVMRYGRHYDVVREDRVFSYLLELHWNLVHNSSRNDEAIKDVWAEARPKTFFGAPAFCLSPEWEFLYLSIHAADHAWRNLKWLTDIHQVASSASVDWQMVMKKAEHLELDLVVRQTLTACSLLLGTPMPEGYSPTALPAKVRLFPAAPFPADTCANYTFRRARAQATSGQAALSCENATYPLPDGPRFLTASIVAELSLLSNAPHALDLQVVLASSQTWLRELYQDAWFLAEQRKIAERYHHACPLRGEAPPISGLLCSGVLRKHRGFGRSDRK